MRESWLKATLKTGGWGLVVGWLGEKMLFSGGVSPEIIGDWTEMNGVGSVDHGGFRIVDTKAKQVSRRTDGRHELDPRSD